MRKILAALILSMIFVAPALVQAVPYCINCLDDTVRCDPNNPSIQQTCINGNWGNFITCDRGCDKGYCILLISSIHPTTSDFYPVGKSISIPVSVVPTPQTTVTVTGQLLKDGVEITNPIPVVTNSAGIATVVFPAIPAGQYEAKFTATDPSGTIVTAASNFVVRDQLILSLTGDDIQYTSFPISFTVRISDTAGNVIDTVDVWDITSDIAGVKQAFLPAYLRTGVYELKLDKISVVGKLNINVKAKKFLYVDSDTVSKSIQAQKPFVKVEHNIPSTASSGDFNIIIKTSDPKNNPVDLAENDEIVLKINKPDGSTEQIALKSLASGEYFTTYTFPDTPGGYYFTISTQKVGYQAKIYGESPEIPIKSTIYQGGGVPGFGNIDLLQLAFIGVPLLLVIWTARGFIFKKKRR